MYIPKNRIQTNLYTNGGEYTEYKVKMWYFVPKIKTETIYKGYLIGTTADISRRYQNSPSMQDHIHLEVRKNGVLKDPLPYFVEKS